MEYAELLLSYDKANVTGVKDREGLIFHFIDSLSCLVVPQLSTASDVVDIGSGGGLPGIPIKIAVPGINMVLLEATQKKCDFLRYVIDTLQIERVSVANVRAEEAGRDPDYRARFDMAVVRAVAELPVLVEYGVPLLKVGGILMAMKGRLSEEELETGGRAAEIIGAKLEDVREVAEVGEGIERRIVLVRKDQLTHSRYPRRTGMPKKRPLGGDRP